MEGSGSLHLQRDKSERDFVLVRIAGLSADFLKSFGSTEWSTRLRQIESLEEHVDECRGRLIESFHGDVPSSGPELRRLILEAKRDCFNKRSIRKWLSRPEWQELQPQTREVAARALSAEERLALAQTELESHFKEVKALESRALLEHSKDPSLRRGITLASPTLARALAIRRDAPLDPSNRRDRKLEQSLLRLLTRSSAKTSPYSTLTYVSFGTLHSGSEQRSSLFLPADQREISLLRIHRGLLDQAREALLCHPPVRAHCLVFSNDTLEDTAAGKVQWIRPAHWRIAPEEPAAFVEPSLIEATVAGPMATSLRALLSSQPMPYARLLELLKERSPEVEPEQIRLQLERFIAMGFVLLVPPWASYEPYLEARIFEHLSKIPITEAPELAAAIESLEKILRLESMFQHAVEPGEVLQELRSQFANLLEISRGLIGPALAPPAEIDNFKCYEDVLKVTDPTGEVVSISEEKAREAVCQSVALYRYADLFNYRHDFGHCLIRFWRERFGTTRSIPFLRLFKEARHLWKQFLHFEALSRHQLSATFNPNELEEVARLAHLRTEIAAKLQGAMQFEANELRLDPEKFESILDGIPERYSPILGPCAFVQPADRHGERWVLNRIFEGTGRYSSRFTAGMNSQSLAWYQASTDFGHEAEVASRGAVLLDLQFSNGNTSNFRHPTSPKIIQLPGEYVPDSNRRVLLSDLVVSVDFDQESFQLHDRHGNRLIPVHMSHLTNIFMPVVLRFLSVFGPYEVRQVCPRPSGQRRAEIMYFERVSTGRVVFARRRWVVPCASLSSVVAGKSGIDALRSLLGWQRANGLPSRVYLYEPLPDSGNSESVRHKPQYLDFSSPLLTALLQQVIEQNQGSLIFEEALPDHVDYPLGEDHRSRAIELQLDSMTLSGLRKSKKFTENFSDSNSRGPNKGTSRPSALMVSEEGIVANRV